MITLHLGDCIATMRGMPADSVDSIVTDPPYELGFMGKTWDASGIAYSVEMWREALRVLKPGGHLLAFSGSRTYHRMVVAIEDAGFEIRDQIMWVYGSGFPKSLDVSKAIDKSRAGHAFDEIRDYLRQAIAGAGLTQVQVKTHLDYPADSGIVSHWVATSQPSVPGWADWQKMKEILPLDERFDALIESAEREKVGEKRSGIADGSGPRHTIGAASSVVVDVTAPATDAARQWQGWGTALKPAHEPICVARKPLVGTVAANVLAHGTGALNVDGCRVATTDTYSYPNRAGGSSFTVGGGVDGSRIDTPTMNALGRWPANLIHDGSDEVLALAGDAARFFYCAKASRADRNEGLPMGAAPAVDTGATMREREDADWIARNGNHHPTVKPTDLMRYLCRLVTPPGGLVLDPFTGSGSTGKAAILEGFRFVGCELSPEYLAIARARIEHAATGGFA